MKRGGGNVFRPWDDDRKSQSDAKLSQINCNPSQTDSHLSQTDSNLSLNDSHPSQTGSNLSLNGSHPSQTDFDLSQTDSNLTQTNSYLSQTDSNPFQNNRSSFNPTDIVIKSELADDGQSDDFRIPKSEKVSRGLDSYSPVLDSYSPVLESSSPVLDSSSPVESKPVLSSFAIAYRGLHLTGQNRLGSTSKFTKSINYFLMDLIKDP